MNAKHSGVAKLWLLNLFGNAALLAAVYLLLILPDAHGWQVAASGLLALIVLFFGVWLRAGSFAYFRLAEFRDNADVWRAFHHSLSHLIALLLWAIPLAAIEWWLFSLRRYAPQFGVWFWQKFSALRFGSPRQICRTADWVLWIAMILLFAIWLPVASTIAATGLKPSRMARALRVLKHPTYWAWLVVLLFVGVYLPRKFIWWIPDLSTLTRQAWSAGARFFLAYVLLISAWVGLLLVVGTRVEKEDSDSLDQPSSDSDSRGL
jgi:hypothetical protein